MNKGVHPAINGATTVIVNDNGTILLQKRRDFRIWGLPGGHIEPGEDPKEAAVRETHEETGYVVAIDFLVGEYHRPQLPQGSGLIFRGHVVGGQAIQQGDETVAVDWFPPNGLPKSLQDTHRIYITDALSEGPFPIQRTLKLSPFYVGFIKIMLWLRNTNNRLRARL